MAYFYFIGIILSFLATLYAAYKETKSGNSIDEFPGVIAGISLLSWIGFILIIYNLYKRDLLF